MADYFEAEDAAITDPDKLVDKARQTLEAGQTGRALRLVKRAFKTRPDDPGIAAVLSSVLRKMGHPNQALEVTDRFKGSRYQPVLTSRAAALCDLERWDEALRQIRQVTAIGQGRGSAEALNVRSRIKAAVPHLFNK